MELWEDFIQIITPLEISKHGFQCRLRDRSLLRFEIYRTSSATTSSRQIATTTVTTTLAATATMSGTATVLSNYLFPTAVSWGYPHLEVFALSDADVPYWKWKNSSSSDPWNPPGNSLESLSGQTAPFENGLAAIARGFGFVDIFCAGSDYALYHKNHSEDLQWEPSLSGWENRGGGLTSPPTVVSWAQDRLDIFVIGDGPAYSLFQQFWDGTSGWSDYSNFGGTWSTFAPTAVSWGPDRIDLFLVNSVDQSLLHKYCDGSNCDGSDGSDWSNSFESLGGYCTSRPIAVSWASGRIDIFVRGGDAGLWHLSYSDGWSSWTSISGNTSIQAEPDAVSWGPNHLDVFAWGADSSLLHKSYDGTTDSWSPKEGFEVVGQGLQGPPKAVSDGVGSVHVFCYTQYGELGHKAWNQTQGLWTPSESFDDLGAF